MDAYLHDYASAAGTVLRWFDSSVQVRGQDIIGRYSLRIVRTCDAMDVKILYVSAVLAWPARWGRRVAAVIVGVAALFVVNVLRICALYFIGVYAPSYFTLAHHELLPVLILIVAVGAFVLFALWTQRASVAAERHELV